MNNLQLKQLRDFVTDCENSIRCVASEHRIDCDDAIEAFRVAAEHDLTTLDADANNHHQRVLATAQAAIAALNERRVLEDPNNNDNNNNNNNNNPIRFFFFRFVFLFLFFFFCCCCALTLPHAQSIAAIDSYVVYTYSEKSVLLWQRFRRRLDEQLKQQQCAAATALAPPPVPPRRAPDHSPPQPKAPSEYV